MSFNFTLMQAKRFYWRATMKSYDGLAGLASSVGIVDIVVRGCQHSEEAASVS
jgi:hypothetical protein